ncbi:MAG: hypothetical protein ATN35_03270 [Epulopiscium sp. Nele67-Bin004]|nr:MAG: hypothetical protein ATN35_03270 [Epulopiscium sp. Nele67-Bin004]
MELVIPEICNKSVQQRLLNIIDDILTNKEIYIREFELYFEQSWHHGGFITKHHSELVPITITNVNETIEWKAINNLCDFLNEFYVYDNEKVVNEAERRFNEIIDEFIPLNRYINLDDPSDEVYDYIDKVNDLWFEMFYDILNSIDYVFYWKKLSKKIPQGTSRAKFWTPEVEAYLKDILPSILTDTIESCTPHLWRPKEISSIDHHGRLRVDRNSGEVYEASKETIDKMLGVNKNLKYLVENLYAGTWMATYEAGRGKEWITYKFIVMNKAFRLIERYVEGIELTSNIGEFRCKIEQTYNNWIKQQPMLNYYNKVVESLKN